MYSDFFFLINFNMLFIELITLSFKIRFNIINNNRLLLLTAPLFIGVIEAVADSITHT